MRKKLKYFQIAGSLVFALGTVIFLTVPGPCRLLPAVCLALAFTVLQQAVWRLTRKKGFISYTLAFSPAASAIVGIVRQSSQWYIVAAVLAVLIACLPALLRRCLPSHRLPQPRLSTTVWVGSFLFLVLAALVIGLTIA